MMDDEKSRTKNIVREIGKRIRYVRNNKGMSLKDLAEKTGFTKSYISQIENLKREPTIRTLSKIAYVLEVDFTFFINNEVRNFEVPSLTIVRKGEGVASLGPSGKEGYLYESLTYKKPDRLMDGYIITIGSEFPPAPLIHEGQEVAYVLEGTQEFVYDGETYILKEGDCFCFDSGKPHYSRTLGKKPGKILLVFAVKKTTTK